MMFPQNHGFKCDLTMVVEGRTQLPSLMLTTRSFDDLLTANACGNITGIVPLELVITAWICLSIPVEMLTV